MKTASLVFFYLMLFHPVSQISARGSVLFGDPGFGCSIFEQRFYLCSMGIELALANAFRASQWHALLLPCSQCLSRSLGDQVPLNFCGHRKGHCHNLALDTVVELPVAFDGIDADTFLHGQGENLHALQHTPPQARQFTDNDRVAFLHLLQNGCNLAFAPGDFARDFLFDELSMPQVRLIGQIQNIEFVLFQILVQFGACG